MPCRRINGETNHLSGCVALVELKVGVLREKVPLIFMRLEEINSYHLRSAEAFNDGANA